MRTYKELAREIRDVEVCRINRAIFVGEADDIPRLGAKPESVRFCSDLLRDTKVLQVCQHFELFENIKSLLLPCLPSLVQQ